MCRFFYLLKGTLYRSPKNFNDLVEIHEVLEDNNPIEARERALNLYQNYIDVFLQSIGLEHDNHDSSRLALNRFLQAKNKPSKLNELLRNFVEEDEAILKIENDFDKGISLYLVMTDAKSFTTLEGELIYEDKILIHDLNSELTGVREHINSSLVKEFELYKKYGYDCKGYATSVKMKDDQMILRTPMVLGPDSR